MFLFSSHGSCPNFLHCKGVNNLSVSHLDILERTTKQFRCVIWRTLDAATIPPTVSKCLLAYCRCISGCLHQAGHHVRCSSTRPCLLPLQKAGAFRAGTGLPRPRVTISGTTESPGIKRVTMSMIRFNEKGEIDFPLHLEPDVLIPIHTLRNMLLLRLLNFDGYFILIDSLFCVTSKLF